MADHEILMENGRFSFTYVYTPYKNKDGNANYTTHWIFPENHPQKAELEALIRQTAADAWKEKADEYLKAAAGQDKLCIHRGDISKPGIAEYKGMLFISASRKIEAPPMTIVDENRRPITIASGKMYSGCWGDLAINLWAQNNAFGRRINAEILGVQHVRYDTKLSGGGAVAAADEFKVRGKDADAAAPDPTGGLI
jgi:hypothetical protein